MMCRFHSSLPRGYSKSRLRATRDRWSLDTEIHHIVPREFARHPSVLREHYEVERDYNLIFMPRHDTDRRHGHSGGHMRYNAFVRDRLEDVSSSHEFVLLLFLLHMGCRGRTLLPWK